MFATDVSADVAAGAGITRNAGQGLVTKRLCSVRRAVAVYPIAFGKAVPCCILAAPFRVASTTQAGAVTVAQSDATPAQVRLLRHQSTHPADRAAAMIPSAALATTNTMMKATIRISGRMVRKGASCWGVVVRRLHAEPHGDERHPVAVEGEDGHLGCLHRSELQAQHAVLAFADLAPGGAIRAVRLGLLGQVFLNPVSAFVVIQLLGHA